MPSKCENCVRGGGGNLLDLIKMLSPIGLKGDNYGSRTASVKTLMEIQER